MGGGGYNYRDNRTSEKSSSAKTKEPQQATNASKVHNLRGAAREDPPSSTDSVTTYNTTSIPRKNSYLTAKTGILGSCRTDNRVFYTTGGNTVHTR